MDPEAGQGKERNDEAREAFPDIFGNPVILKHILEQLPNSKLLELSLVSKLWKKEARIVMKNRGNLMALLDNKDYTRGCGKAFQAFAANLETLNEALYSGMTIEFSTIRDCRGTGALEPGAIHESILAGMRGTFKRVSIRLYKQDVCWNNARDCPNFILLRLLLRDFIGDLEHLTLEIRDIMEPFIQQFLPPGPYPKLKVLKLKDELYDWYCHPSNEETNGHQIRMLLSRAPNLQEIRTFAHVSLRENLMEGKEGVVHVHESLVKDAVEDISENVIPALRLKWIYFWYTTEPEFGLDRFNEKAQSLLRTCCATTLKTLNLNAVSAVLFMSYGIPLVNVKGLQISLIYIEVEQFEPRILSTLSRFDFTFLFPSLNKVGIYVSVPHPSEFSRDTINAIIEQANAVLMEPTPVRARNIKYLDLFQYSIPVAAIEFCAHMVPAIEELEIRGQYLEDNTVGTARELWPDLKSIKVNQDWSLLCP